MVISHSRMWQFTRGYHSGFVQSFFTSSFPWSAGAHGVADQGPGAASAECRQLPVDCSQGLRLRSSWLRTPTTPTHWASTFHSSRFWPSTCPQLGGFRMIFPIFQTSFVEDFPWFSWENWWENWWSKGFPPQKIPHFLWRIFHGKNWRFFSPKAWKDPSLRSIPESRAPRRPLALAQGGVAPPPARPPPREPSLRSEAREGAMGYGWFMADLWLVGGVSMPCFNDFCMG